MNEKLRSLLLRRPDDRLHPGDGIMHNIHMQIGKHSEGYGFAHVHSPFSP